MILIGQIVFLIITYFFAAIPFGLLISKFFAKTDIRQHGSGNIGATNVARIVGKKLGLLTLILDGFKGALMVIAARFIFQSASFLHLYLVIIAMVAVLAHIFPIYLSFKGGKGVATSLAVLIALDFPIGFLAICFWIMTYAAFRISSISSLVAVFSSAIASLAFETPVSQIIFCWLLFCLILYRHKENLLRISRGEEKKL